MAQCFWCAGITKPTQYFREHKDHRMGLVPLGKRGCWAKDSGHCVENSQLTSDYYCKIGSHGASKTKTYLGHYPQGHTSHCFACRKIDLICTTELSCSPADRNGKFLMVSSTPEESSLRNDLQFALLNPGVHFEKWWVSAEQTAVPECQRYLPASSVLKAVRLRDCWVSGSGL